MSGAKGRDKRPAFDRLHKAINSDLGSGLGTGPFRSKDWFCADAGTSPPSIAMAAPAPLTTVLKAAAARIIFDLVVDYDCLHKA